MCIAKPTVFNAESETETEIKAEEDEIHIVKKNKTLKYPLYTYLYSQALW